MKPFLTLIKLQLRNYYDLTFIKSRRTLLVTIILGLLLFAAYLFGLRFAIQNLVNYHIVGWDLTVPEHFIVLVFAITFTAFFLSSIVKITRGLYINEDNKILLTFPVNPSMVFLSKIVTFYIMELLRNILFIVPFFIVVGMINHYGAVYYVGLISGYMLISLIPIAISSLISIPFLFMTMFLKNWPIFSFVIYGALTTVVVYYLFRAISFIPPDFNFVEGFAVYFWKIQDFLNYFHDKFSIFTELTKILVGTRTSYGQIPFTSGILITMLIAIGTSIFCLMLSFVLARPLFNKMAASPFEYKKNEKKRPRKNKVRSHYLTFLKKELLMIVKSPKAFFKEFSILLVLPLVTYTLNQVFSSMDTKLAGDSLILSFNLLIMLLVILSYNTKSANLISQEGRSYYLIHTLPVSIFQKILARINVSGIITILAIIINFSAFTDFNQINNYQKVLILVILFTVYIAHLFWNMGMDMEKPQYEIFVDGENLQGSKNERMSSLLAYLLSFGVFLLSFLFFRDGDINGAMLKLALIAFALAGWRLIIFILKSKIYLRTADTKYVEAFKGGEGH